MINNCNEDAELKLADISGCSLMEKYSETGMLISAYNKL
jgi:hypothetical protein